LLRADIHTLFDLGLIAIDSDNCLAVAASLADSDYSALHAKPLAMPTDPGCRPSVEALKWHFESHSKHDRLS
jgi:hypothetical protein